MWSKEKQDYCCTHFNQACDRFDCDYLQSCLDAERKKASSNESDDVQVPKKMTFGKTFVNFDSMTSSGKVKISQNMPFTFPFYPHFTTNQTSKYSKHIMPEIVMKARSRVVFPAVPALRSPSVSLQVIARNCGRRRNSPGALDGCNI